MNYLSHTTGLLKMKDNGAEYLKSTPVAMVAPELKHETSLGITKTCAVIGCDDSKNLSDEEYFRFPEDLKRRQIWMELTGRSNWTPTDYSYVCIQHFSVDSFECNADNEVVLTQNAVPSLKLPRHVLEVEYIDEETLENEFDYESDSSHTEETAHTSKINGTQKPKHTNIELLKLFTEVQTMQRKAVGLKDKLKLNMKIYNRQNRFLERLKRIAEMKKNVLNQKREKRKRILLSLQDKIREDKNGLVLAMPVKYNEDLKDFALSVYKYSPQAYIYARNSLRTMLPSADVLENWINSGYVPRNLLKNNSMVKVTAEQTESELTCKVSLVHND